MYSKAVKTYLKITNLVADQRGELDEKALLIALFVIAAIAGLSTLAGAVSDRFLTLAGSL
jgi:Flp pilus assembly pilin Flp